MKIGFLPETMLPQVVSMISREKNCSGITQSLPVEFIEHFAQLLVHKGDGCIVGLPHPSSTLFCFIQSMPHIAVCCLRNVVHIAFDHGGDFHLFQWIHIEKLFRCHHRVVRTEETHAHEEGLSRFLPFPD